MNPLLSLGLAIGRNALLGRPPGTGLPTGPDAFRIPVRSEPSRERISRILAAFFGGFEGGLRSPRRDRGPGDLDPVFHPFFHEGRAMGIAARISFGRGAWDGFGERAAAREGERFLFLKWVGLGFWLGFRHSRRPDRVEAIARRVGKHGDLVLDGYGFKVGFFDCRRGLRAAERLLGIGGPAKLGPEAAAQVANGVGRSRWFFAMDDPARAFAEARRLGGSAGAVLGGMGLASAFTRPDDLSRAYAAADSLGGEERSSFVKGIRIALYVRDADDPEVLEGWLARQAGPVEARARRDLAVARKVGGETRARDDFIAAFHRGCLDSGEEGR